VQTGHYYYCTAEAGGPQQTFLRQVPVKQELLKLPVASVQPAIFCYVCMLEPNNRHSFQSSPPLLHQTETLEMRTLQIHAETSTLPATRALEHMLSIESSAQDSRHQQVQQDKTVANPTTSLSFDTPTLLDAVTFSLMKQPHHHQLPEFPTIEWCGNEEDGALFDFNCIMLMELHNYPASHGCKPSLSRSIAFACDLARLSEEPHLA